MEQSTGKARLWHQKLEHLDLLDLVGLLSLVLVLLHNKFAWYIQTPLTALAIAGIILTQFRSQSWFWFIVTLFLAAANIHHWYENDNHDFLLTYWFLALTLAYELDKPARLAALKTSGKYLIGLCMLFAVIWKAWSPEYLSGEFFYFTLLTDPRFASLTHALSGLSFADLQQNRLMLDGLQAWPGESSPRLASLVTAWAVQPVANVLTWWTIGIETVIALLFLLPMQRLERFAHAVLIMFLASTYIVATVKGFGWTLILLGLVQCHPDRDRMLLGIYIGLFILIECYSAPLFDLFVKPVIG